MGSVEPLVDGLTEQEEIVRVRNHKDGADSIITVGIPNVVLRIHRDVVFGEHHFEGLKEVHLCAVNEDHTLLNSVIGVPAGGFDDTVNDRLEKH